MISRTAHTLRLKGKFEAGEKRSDHETAEFGPGKRGLVFCPRGEAVYYKKSWHHTSEFFSNPPDFTKKKGIIFKLCPADMMLKNKQYEGEITIRNVPEAVREDLVRRIENMGETAMRIDVLDRVSEIAVKESGIRVTTTENQLAQKIAKNIAAAFKKKVAMRISRGKESDVVRVTIDFI